MKIDKHYDLTNNVYQFCKQLSKKEITNLTSNDVNKILQNIDKALDDQSLTVEETYYFKRAVELLDHTSSIADNNEVKNKIKDTQVLIDKVSQSMILKDRTVSYTDWILSPLNPSYATRKSSDKDKLFMDLQEKMETMKALGGERRNVTGEHGLKIDGILFTVDTFAKSIEDNQGKFVTLTIGAKENQKTLSAIQIDPSKSEKLIDLLEKMEMFKAGWERVKVGDKEFIVKKEDVDPVKNSTDLQITDKEFKQGINRPIVVISAGQEGYYEFYLHQVAALAMQGVNVRLYNYTGKGESEGEEITDQSRLQDIRAVYDDVKQQTSEDLIILQGISVGAGPTSDLAAKITSSGRDVNLMLIKSPSNYLAVAKMMTKGWINSIIDSYAENLYIPRYEVSENLKLVKGHKLLVLPKEDDLSNKKHKLANIESLMLQHKNNDLLKVIEPTGKHNYSWNKDEPTRVEIISWIADVCTKRDTKLQPVL